MACKDETREIDGHTYYVSQLPPTRAIPLSVRIMKLIGPALPELAKLAPKGKEMELSKIDAGVALKAVTLIFDKCDETEFMKLLKDVVTLARRDGDVVNDIDTVYGGDMMNMFKVAMFVVEVNYKSFIPALGN